MAYMDVEIFMTGSVNNRKSVSELTRWRDIGLCH
jgi:hypothetical protein